nr:hypothetical protein [Tanacetum cinerariifolium]
ELGKIELFGNCYCGFVKMDGVDGEKYIENGSKFKKINESNVTLVGVHWDEDSIMDVDQVCEEVGKCSELELIVSCKVDVDGMRSDTKYDSINLEFTDDGKGNEGQSSGEEIHNYGLKILDKLSKEKVEVKDNKKQGSFCNLVSLGKIRDGDKGSEVNKSNVRPLDDEYDMYVLGVEKKSKDGENFSKDICVKIDCVGSSFAELYFSPSTPSILTNPQ